MICPGDFAKYARVGRDYAPPRRTKRRAKAKHRARVNRDYATPKRTNKGLKAKHLARQSPAYKITKNLTRVGEWIVPAAAGVALAPVSPAAAAAAKMSGYPAAELLHAVDPRSPVLLGMKEGMDPFRKLVRKMLNKIKDKARFK